MTTLSQSFFERTAAVSLLGAAALLVWFAAVAPVVAAIETRRSDLAGLSERYRNYVSRRTSMVADTDEELLQRIRASLYPTADIGITASRLQSDHQRLAQQAGLHITGLQVRPEQSGEVVTGANLQVSASGTIKEFENYLIGVRHHPRLLHIEDLSIFAPERQSADRNPVLNMSWTLTGVVENAGT